MKKKKNTPYEPDPLDLRYRRRRRQQRERLLKWLLAAAALLIIILIAVIFRKIALERINEDFKAPSENSTYWFEETEGAAFRTVTPTMTMTPTATVPTPTPTETFTPTPTISPTPTLTPTPRIRPRKTVEGNAAENLMQAESTRAVRHNQEKSNKESLPFEPFNNFVAFFDAAEVYPNSDCSWMGVAGVLIDQRGEPQIGYYVQIGLPDGSMAETRSGLFPAYGPSGYELTIARPVRSFDEPILIQVLDEDHVPVSEEYTFMPDSDCSKSLTIINFLKTK